MASQCFFVSGDTRMRVTSSLSLRTIGRGVFTGTSQPNQVSQLYPGTPASASVGRSGMTATRFAGAAASATTFPALTCGSTFATGDRERNAPGHGFGERLRYALERHVAHIQLGQGLEQFRG